MTSLFVLHAEFYVHAQITKTQFWASKNVYMKPCEILICTTITVFQVGLTIQLNFMTFKV